MSSYRSVSIPAPCSKRGKVYPDEQHSAKRYKSSLPSRYQLAAPPRSPPFSSLAGSHQRRISGHYDAQFLTRDRHGIGATGEIQFFHPHHEEMVALRPPSDDSIRVRTKEEDTMCSAVLNLASHPMT